MNKPLAYLAQCLSILVLSLSLPVLADDGYKFVELKPISNMAELAAQTQREGRAILLMFSGDHCRYCTEVEEDFLKPMLRSGDYDALISMHKVQLASRQTLIDFDGNPISVAQLAKRYQVIVMPTVVFLDGQGHEVGEKRVGLMTPAFYGGYLDTSIRDAARAVQQSRLSALRN